MKIKKISIQGRSIGPEYPPYIIAEMSANHNGRIEAALQIIDEAQRAGAHAVKIQTFTAQTMTLNSSRPEFRIEGGIWSGRTLYDLYDEAHMPWEWHKLLFEHARLRGITLFSSPFDRTAVDLLEDLNAPAYKIASFEIVDLPLIKYAASTGKPLIISTGMADQEEIQEAVDAAFEGGSSEVALLHCVSGYPAPASDYNLRLLGDMAERFGVVTGLSDHTIDNTTAIAAVALGACLIEKHLTLDRRGGGPDDSFSLEPAGLAELCRSSVDAWQALGQVDYGRQASERGNARYRRSLYFTRSLAAGEFVGPDDIQSVRPGLGLPPKWLPRLIGLRLSRRAILHEPVELHHFDPSDLNLPS